mmetsp:Transcript_41760/g.87192  ORF Transcript_41760/g.87192 Transcript_41760/m.87192 type:complete len:83 (-) Transcript_41760:775-1023(-)
MSTQAKPTPSNQDSSLSTEVSMNQTEPRQSDQEILRMLNLEREKGAHLREELARLKKLSGVETEGDGNKKAKSTGGSFTFEF